LKILKLQKSGIFDVLVLARQNYRLYSIYKL
jgi:hypothetical protein